MPAIVDGARAQRPSFDPTPCTPYRAGMPGADLAIVPVWSIFNGTIVNALTVVLGSSAGLLVGHKIAERYQKVILQSLGLVTLWLGFDAAINEFQRAVPGPAATYGPRLGLLLVASLVIGALLGTGLRLQDRIEQLGQWIHHRFAAESKHSVAEGFLSASVIFCVGPLTLLGCFENGTPPHDPSYLYIKSLLDGFCSIALAASLGLGVLFSVITVLGFQGLLTTAAYLASGLLADDVSLGLAKAAGGLVLIGNGLLLLEIKRLPIADFLPAIFVPPVLVAIIRAVNPAWLGPTG